MVRHFFLFKQFLFNCMIIFNVIVSIGPMSVCDATTTFTTFFIPVHVYDLYMFYEWKHWHTLLHIFQICQTFEMKKAEFN